MSVVYLFLFVGAIAAPGDPPEALLASREATPGALSMIQLAEPVCALSHLLGAVVFLLLGVGLVRRGRPAPERLASLAIYVAGVVAMLTASGLYHLAGPDHPWHAVLRRIDHAAIWLQIAGTMTPIHVIFFRGGWRRWPLTVVWTGAFFGILLKLVFFEHVSEGPGLALYLALGWSGVFSPSSSSRSAAGP